MDGIVRFRSDFSSRLKRGDGEVQVIVNGTDANTARIIQSYAQGVVLAMGAAPEAPRAGRVTGLGPVSVQSRVWFNESGRQQLLPRARA